MRLQSIKSLLENIGSNRRYYMSLTTTQQTQLLKRINRASETAYQQVNPNRLHRLQIERCELEETREETNRLENIHSTE